MQARMLSCWLIHTKQAERVSGTAGCVQLARVPSILPESRADLQRCSQIALLQS